MGRGFPSYRDTSAAVEEMARAAEEGRSGYLSSSTHSDDALDALEGGAGYDDGLTSAGMAVAGAATAAASVAGGGPSRRRRGAVMYGDLPDDEAATLGLGGTIDDLHATDSFGLELGGVMPAADPLAYPSRLPTDARLRTALGGGLGGSLGRGLGAGDSFDCRDDALDDEVVAAEAAELLGVTGNLLGGASGLGGLGGLAARDSVNASARHGVGRRAAAGVRLESPAFSGGGDGMGIGDELSGGGGLTPPDDDEPDALLTSLEAAARARRGVVGADAAWLGDP